MLYGNDVAWIVSRRLFIGVGVSLLLAFIFQRRKAAKALAVCGMSFALLSSLYILRQSEGPVFGAIFLVPPAVAIICVEAWIVAKAKKEKWQFGLIDVAEFVAYVGIAIAIAVRTPF